MSLAEMHRSWVDAVPAKSFPFRYVDKKRGQVYAQTWADVKRKNNEDATSLAMPFCTGHATASVLQSKVIHDSIVREDRAALRQRRLLEQKALATTGGHPAEHTASIVAGRPVQGGAAPPQRSTAEEEALFKSQGGRREYLRLRRQRPVQERFGLQLTSSQRYGWEQLSHEPAPPEVPPSPTSATLPRLVSAHSRPAASEFVPMQKRAARPATGPQTTRVSFTRQCARPTGIFPKSEFVA